MGLNFIPQVGPNFILREAFMDGVAFVVFKSAFIGGSVRRNK